ncbi:MAG: hypothetical protein JF565_00925 [Propionibacteriales bacterium]|nr:hypothetical protein [Propionibacteriales bacterium]
MPAKVSDELVEQRIIEQAARLPAGTAVTGWAALRLAGGNYFDGLTDGGRSRRPVPLALGQSGTLKPGRGATVSREPLGDSEIWMLHGVRCTRPLRALFDEMRSVADDREAVVAMDMAAAARLVAVWQMVEYWEGHSGWRRAQRVGRTLPLAEERSRSPAESRLRLFWVLDAGLPRPLCNRPVFDLDGRHLGTPDLLDLETGVVGEYDGKVHLNAGRRAKDAARQCRFRDAGLEYFEVLAPDMHDRDLVVRRMLSARNRAIEARRPRRWTVDPPDDWPTELTYGEELRWRRSLHEL